MMREVYRSLILKRIKLLNGFKRTLCSNQATQKFVYTKLNSRSLIRLKGADDSIIKFLQGLVTNDINYFEKNSSVHLNAMYAFVLNTGGRILYDILMYNRENNGQILLECDKTIVEDLKKTLSMYRLRKKIDIDRVDGELTVFSVYENDTPASKSETTPTTTNFNFDTTFSCPDPRLPLLGHRVILRNEQNPVDIFKPLEEKPEQFYHSRRYRLGVGEGSLDLPTGNCFPLESNGDYLNGISFHKGCYIGQELTARTHHTGVVRKRLMPLIFEQSTSIDDVQQIKPEAKIMNESNDNVGKFRNACGNVGLALLRIEEALKSNQLYVQTHDGNSLKCKTTKPDWWMDKNSNILGEIHGFQPTPTS